MIIDVCTHVGEWFRRPVGLEAGDLARLLAPYGVTQLYAGRLQALWYENPHDANRDWPSPQRASVPPEVSIVAVPVLDPTIATWREELDRLARQGPLRIVRLFPNYGGYHLKDADPLLGELARRKIVAQVIVRMDDPRRQHPRAQIPDVSATEVCDAAVRHPGLSVLLSGASAPSLQTLAARLANDKVRNLWADTSQADGLGTINALSQTAWSDRLVFGSHAPLFIPYAAVARVLFELDDASATQIFQSNPRALFGLGEG